MSDQDSMARRQPPALARVFRAQLRRMLAGRQTGLWVAFTLVLAQVLALAIWGVVFAVTITTGGEGATTVLFTRISTLDATFPLDEGTASLTFTALALVLWGFLRPLSLWNGEPPSRRTYHGSLPVDRRLHDLLRVAAGGVGMLALSLLFALAAVLAAAASGHGAGLLSWSPWVWPHLFLAPLTAYLLVSIPAVRSDHPAAWFWGTAGALALGNALIAAAAGDASTALLSPAFRGSFGLLWALGAPVVQELLAPGTVGAGHLLPALLWPSLAAGAVVLAASSRSRSL